MFPTSSTSPGTSHQRVPGASRSLFLTCPFSSPFRERSTAPNNARVKPCCAPPVTPPERSWSSLASARDPKTPQHRGPSRTRKPRNRCPQAEERRADRTDSGSPPCDGRFLEARTPMENRHGRSLDSPKLQEKRPAQDRL